MLRNYLKIAVRSLWKNRLFTTINIVGLSTGLASVIILLLFVQKSFTFDAFHRDIGRLYFVQTKSDDKAYGQTVYPLLGQLLEEYPEIETGTHIQTWSYPWITANGKNVQESTVYADSTFFDVFSFPLKYGDAATALKTKRSVVLVDKVAQNLFGDTNPVGKVVTLDDTLQYTVTGVLKELPANSSIQFDVLLPATNLYDFPGFKEGADWYNTFAQIFVKLRPDADPRKLEAKFPALVKTHFHREAQNRQILLAPVKDRVFIDEPNFKNILYGAITIAAFILLITSINLINLSMASSLTRIKEVSVKRVIGSATRQILAQFWVEAGLVVFLSLGLSLLFAFYVLVPQFNEFRQGRMQLTIDLTTDYPTFLRVFGIALLVTLVAGTYPAYQLNKLNLTNSLKGKLQSNPRGNRMTQNSLIVVQFAIAVLFIIGTIAVRQQISFMKRADLGFNKDNLLVVSTNLDYKDPKTANSQFTGIIDRLRKNPHVTSLASSAVIPTRYWSNYNDYEPVGTTRKFVNLRHVAGGIGYTQTFGIRLVEGRDFSETIASDATSKPVLINESAKKAFGWTTAVGKQIQGRNSSEVMTVIGVMKDFHYQSLKDKIEPLLHWYGGKMDLKDYLTIRLDDVRNSPAIVAELEAAFKQIPAKRPFKYVYMSDEVDKTYMGTEGVWKMINFTAILAILTACAGIFGLITLAARQRTKEIGIRKVLGASVVSITVMLCRHFLWLVALAALIAIPLAYWGLDKYLSAYAYRAPLSAWVFVAGGISALLIALLTISYQTIRAALINPVRSLRSE